MSDKNFSEFFARLHSDPKFRARFAASPAAVLAEAGFDPKKLQLPSNIDADELAGRLERLFSGRQVYEVPTPEVAEKLSADELWSRFNVIRGTASHSAGDTVPLVVAVVAYGTPPVTGTPVVVTGHQLPEMPGKLPEQQLPGKQPSAVKVEPKLNQAERLSTKLKKP